MPKERIPEMHKRISCLTQDGPWEMERSERRATLMPSSGLMSIVEDGLESNNLEEWVGRSRSGPNPVKAIPRVIDLRTIIESVELHVFSLQGYSLGNTRLLCNRVKSSRFLTQVETGKNLPRKPRSFVLL